LVAPIWVKVAPPAAVPKPLNNRTSPAAAPLPAKSADGVAARFTRVEDEGVVAGVAGQRVRARFAVEGVDAGVAEQRVHQAVWP
jgi:hypothetical protein